MPELPEVETTARGIAPFLIGQKFVSVRVNQPSLRWPIPSDFSQRLLNEVCVSVTRRAKYLLIETETTKILSHLGMSGSFRLVDSKTPLKHQHLELWKHFKNKNNNCKWLNLYHHKFQAFKTWNFLNFKIQTCLQKCQSMKHSNFKIFTFQVSRFQAFKALRLQGLKALKLWAWSFEIWLWIFEVSSCQSLKASMP